MAKQTKSELIRALLPLLNSGRIVLPCNDPLQGQIVGLERRTSVVGRDTISHPDRGHDDVANAVAGAAALFKFGGYDTSMRWVRLDCEDTRLDFSNRNLKVLDEPDSEPRVRNGIGGSSELNHRDDDQPLLRIDKKHRAGRTCSNEMTELIRAPAWRHKIVSFVSACEPHAREKEIQSH